MAGAPCSPAIDIVGTNSGNFNTLSAVCYRTQATVNGWGCSNCDGRTVTINNVLEPGSTGSAATAWTDGYTYFAVTAGTETYAALYYF